MDFGVCSPAEDMWRVMAGGQIGNHESEHDLAVMVSDFMENGSGGADSWCSSDSDSGFSDLSHLADTISVMMLQCVQPNGRAEARFLEVITSILILRVLEEETLINS